MYTAIANEPINFSFLQPRWYVSNLFKFHDLYAADGADWLGVIPLILARIARLLRVSRRSSWPHWLTDTSLLSELAGSYFREMLHLQGYYSLSLYIWHLHPPNLFHPPHNSLESQAWLFIAGQHWSQSSQYCIRAANNVTHPVSGDWISVCLLWGGGGCWVTEWISPGAEARRGCYHVTGTAPTVK